MTAYYRLFALLFVLVALWCTSCSDEDSGPDPTPTPTASTRVATAPTARGSTTAVPAPTQISEKARASALSGAKVLACNGPDTILVGQVGGRALQPSLVPKQGLGPGDMKSLDSGYCRLAIDWMSQGQAGPVGYFDGPSRVTVSAPAALCKYDSDGYGNGPWFFIPVAPFSFPGKAAVTRGDECPDMIDWAGPSCSISRNYQCPTLYPKQTYTNQTYLTQIVRPKVEIIIWAGVACESLTLESADVLRHCKILGQ